VFGLSGQNCGALTRILVSRERHDELVAFLKRECEAAKIGGAYDSDVDLASLATQRQLERVEELIAVGIREGARLVTGGKRPAGLDGGHFIEPTVFADVDRSMSIAQEEIFGPVLVVMAFTDLDDAIEIANDSKYGLVGAVFTHDAKQALAVARRVRTGTMGQNGARTDFSVGFGGFKQSGLGREGGIQGLHGFLETKTLLLD
jgi:betaine-aldehyde dehydrogenase